MATDYFELYRVVLATINGSNPETAQQLFNFLSCTEYVMNEKDKNTNLAKDTLLVLDNLIDDGLVNGHRTVTKLDPPQYMLNGLTTAGQNYLLNFSDKATTDKLKAYLKENGIPTTIQSISKCIAQLVL